MIWRTEKFEQFVVSCKIALYSHDAQKVLVMKYRHGYGLPGGHLEKGETPEQALRRELMEELRISVGPIERKDFFLREVDHGALILGFIGRADKDVVLDPSDPHFEVGEWVTLEEMEALEPLWPEYKRMARENWPQA